MPKKVFFESAVHQFLTAARDVSSPESACADDVDRWQAFIASLTFSYPRPSIVRVAWSSPQRGESTFEVASTRFYRRGGVPGDSGRGLAPAGSAADPVQSANARFFRDVVSRIAAEAGLPHAASGAAAAEAGGASDRFIAEEHFHDEWASTEDAASIDVRRANEACTAPEMRFIRQAVGPLRGKTLLDVGCGLGEASVYFALEGAEVTATDISQRMLDRTLALAERHGVRIHAHKTAAERFALPLQQQFDVIYAGNLFHHVDIEPTLQSILPHLKPGGTLASWDPVAYNPLINIYRRIATEVRTKDEHPLRLKDLRLFKRHFAAVHLRWFWLTTLVIFVIMATVERRNPNKERYWKAIVSEGDRWAWLYNPLERFDKAVLTVAPFLRPLCWNVVVIATNPKRGAVSVP